MTDKHDPTVRVWDLPTRLFHWLLVVQVLAAYVTGQIGGSMIEWHGRAGVAITGTPALKQPEVGVVAVLGGRANHERALTERGSRELGGR